MNRKRRKTSAVWGFFTIIDTEYATCNMCRNKISYRTSVSNLKKHIQKKHSTIAIPGASGTSQITTAALVHGSITSSSTANIATTPALTDVGVNISVPCQQVRTQPMLNFSRNRMTAVEQSNATKQLLKLFIFDFQPFSVVENVGFRAFVEAINPNYQLPSRHTISNSLIPAIYEKTLLEAKEAVGTVVKVCLTTDCWTSGNNDSFMAVTIHFLNAEFQMNSLTVDCSHMEVNHTSINLAKRLREVVQEWCLQGKIALAVSDNASNITKAITEELGWSHLGCFAHTLNFIVKGALEAVASLVDSVTAIVDHFKRSTSAWEKLKQYQSSFNGGQPKKLIQQVPMRWNSTFYMLQRFVELQEAVRSTLGLLNTQLPILSSVDWERLSQLCEILQPFEEVTRAISAQRYATASLVIVYANGLRDVCQRNLMKSSYENKVAVVLKKLMDGINTRLANIESDTTLAVCTFLDPRFKTYAFSEPAAAESAKKCVANAISGKLSAQSGDTTYGNSETTENTKQIKELSVLSFLSKSVGHTQQKGTARANMEIQRYMEDEIHPADQDPLEWWRVNNFKYPHLSSIVAEYLCCLATSVPCEQLFAKAGMLLNERRSKITNKKLEKLLFLNSYFQYNKQI